MFKKVGAQTVQQYIASVPKERKKSLLAVDKLIRQAAPTLKRHFSYNMIGYGSFPYRNYKNENILWPIIALANQKNYISVYVCALERGEYIAEKYKDELGKVSVGKSCIRFKDIEDVDVATLKMVIKKAHKSPGLRNN